jgi:hypothetical protein
LKNAGLKLKPSKCEFLQDEVVYLGHVVCKDGIKPNPKVIESVKIGKLLKQLRKFKYIWVYVHLSSIRAQV